MHKIQGFMKKWLLPALALLCCGALRAQNPIIRTSYTPDPAPYVHGDRLYLAVDHDEDDATYFKMKDWQLYSTEDMVNWTYLGTPVSTATFPWAFQGDRAWASQLIERNGKWYWYVCLTEAATRGDALAVAVADDPQGPYRDAIGGPLARGFAFIDPTGFIDDDGSAVIIDYKTDYIKTDDPAQVVKEVKKRHAEQLELYAAAVEASGIKVKSRYVWLLRKDMAIEV